MKKKYIEPESKVIAVAMSTILAGSGELNPTGFTVSNGIDEEDEM